MMQIPLPYRIRPLTKTATGTDSHGNSTTEYVAAQWVPCIWYIPTGSSDEPQRDPTAANVAGTERVLTSMVAVVEATHESAFAPNDLAELEISPARNLTVQIVGRPGDYNHGPWWEPGLITLSLRQIEDYS